MLSRGQMLADLTSRTFDVLVIGGGITGAGIARDAVMRGLSVALIDKGDFASGTSSRSSRLIHGGVRYLEHGHLRLVFEASAERHRLLRIAPDLVHPLSFTWPVYRGQRLSLTTLRAGLSLYDALSLFRNVGRHRTLDPEALVAVEPAVRRELLVGGVQYHDAATDDTRLTLANVLDARRRGAVVANHVVFMGAAPDSGEAVRLARVEDALDGTRAEIRAIVIVNAAGPWSDAVRALAASDSDRRVQGSKGVHIAVPRNRVGNAGAITMLHPRDGRVMFILPAGTQAIIGTTDTFTTVSPDEVRADEADVRYLLDGGNASFPDARLDRADVIAAWAGIRPLLPTKGSSVGATREHQIRTHGRTVTITGGKLTTYRVMASQVVDVVQRLLRRPVRRADTGRELLMLARPATRADSQEIVPGLPYRMDAIGFAVESEMASTLGDLLIRRTHVAYETRDNGRAAARRVAALLGWDAKEIERYDGEVARIFSIDP